MTDGSTRRAIPVVQIVGSLITEVKARRMKPFSTVVTLDHLFVVVPDTTAEAVLRDKSLRFFAHPLATDQTGTEADAVLTVTGSAVVRVASKGRWYCMVRVLALPGGR
jgi:hypothetical protein